MQEVPILCIQCTHRILYVWAYALVTIALIPHLNGNIFLHNMQTFMNAESIETQRCRNPRSPEYLPHTQCFPQQKKKKKKSVPRESRWIAGSPVNPSAQAIKCNRGGRAQRMREESGSLRVADFSKRENIEEVGKTCSAHADISEQCT